MTMPTAPGAQIAGRLEVPVVADLTGFRDDLIDGVKKASKGVNAEVGVKLNTAGLRKRLQDAVDRASRGVNAKVGISWDSTGLRRRLQTAVDTASKGITAKVGIEVDGDNLRAKFEAAAEAAAKGVTGTVKVKVDYDDARKQLEDAFSRETVKVRIDKDALRDDVARALEQAGSGGSGGGGGGGSSGTGGSDSGRPARPPRTTDPEGSTEGFLARLKARITAARALAKANPVDVPVNVDPKSHFGNPPALRKVLRGALIGSVVSLIQPAIAAVGGLIVPLGALVGPLGQAVGGLGALAPLLGAVATGAVAGVVGFKGVGDALGALSEASKTAGKDAEQLAADQEKLAEAMENLSPSAQGVVREMFAVKQAFAPVRKVVQERLFEKLAGHIEEPIKRAIPTLQRGLELAGSQVGQLVADLSHLAGSEEFLRPLGRFFESTNRVLAPLRRAAVPLTKALVIFFAAAGPAAERLAKGFERGARNLERMVNQGDRTGKIDDFLQNGIDQLSRLWRMTKNVLGGLKGMAEAASPAGDSLLGRLDTTLRHFNEWANSTKGQNAIADYVNDMLPVFDEMLGLIGDIGEALGRMARDPDTALLVKQIRDELLPAVEKFLTVIGDNLGPAVVDIISSLVTVLANLGESGGGIAIAVQAIDELFDLLNGFLEDHQTTAKVLGGILGVIAGAAILRVGLSLFLKPFKGVLGALTGFGSKGAGAGLATLTSLFKLKMPTWMGGPGAPGTSGQNPEGVGKDAKNISRTIQRVTWGIRTFAYQALPVYVVNQTGGGTTAAGADGDGKNKPKPSTRKPPVSGIRGKLAAGALALGVGAAGFGRRLIGRRGKGVAGPSTTRTGTRITGTPVIPGSTQSKARRAAAAAQGQKALNPKSVVGRIGDIAKKVPGKGTVLGILGSLAAAPVAKAIKGDGKNTSRNVAGGALSGAVNGAGLGALIGSIIPGAGTAVGAAVGGAAGGIWGGITAGFPEVDKKVKNWATGLGGVAAGLITKAGSKGKAFKWVSKNADEVIPAVKGSFGKVSKVVTDSLVPAVKGAGSKAKEIAGSIGTGLAGAGKTAGTKLAEVGRAAKDQLGKAGAAAKSGATSAINTMSTALGAAKGKATAKFAEVTGAAKSKLTDTANTLRERGGNAVNTLTTALGGARAKATTKFGEVTAAARSKITETASTLRERGGNAVNLLTSALGTARGKATTKFGEVTTAARTQLSTTASTARTKAGEVSNKISEGLGKAKGYTTTKMGAVKSEADRITKNLVSSVGTHLNGIKAKFSGPIKYVGNTVFGGFRTVFNAISGKIGGPKIDPIRLGFAKGGVVPGYAPGRDTVPAMVSPGEGWLVPEAVKGLARQLGMPARAAVQKLNAAFSSRVQDPGNPRRPRGYSKGGVVPGGVQHFALGGIPDYLSGALAKGKSVWDGATDNAKRVANLVKDVVVGAARKAFDAAIGPVNGLLDRIPGAGDMKKVAKAGGTTLVKAAGSFLTGKDRAYSAAGGGGSGPGGFGYNPGSGATQSIVAFGRWLQSKGARVAEHPMFGGVAPVHSGRGHYEGRAVDVNTRPGTSAQEQRELAPLVAEAIRRGFMTIFMAAGHYGHAHIEAQRARRAPNLGQGATVLPRPGGTLARIAEAGRAESVVDTGKLNTVLDRIIAQRSGSDVVFQPGSVVVHNPAPEPASQSVQATLTRVAAFGLFG